MTKNIADTSWSFTATGYGGTYNSNEPNGTAAVLLFSDNFSSGDLSKTENGFIWGAPSNTSVSTLNPLSGTYSLLFDFQYTVAGEQRFDMGSLYNELTFEYEIYIPDGTESWGGLIYDHYNSEGGASDNNKWHRLWDTNTESGNDEKVGASTRASDTTGLSKLSAEWDDDTTGVTGQTPPSAYQDFITAADRGTWIKLKFYYKSATVANNDGVLKFYKDDVLIMSKTDVNNYHAGYDHAWQYGYLLGSQGGKLPMAGDHLYLFIDNFSLWSGEA